MDGIDRARQALESAEAEFEGLLDLIEAGQSVPVWQTDELAQRIADLEAAYFRAVDMWEPGGTAGIPHKPWCGASATHPHVVPTSADVLCCGRDVRNATNWPA